MADNSRAGVAVGTGVLFVTAEVSFGGDTAQVAGSFPGILSGTEGSRSYDLIVGGAGAVAAGVQRTTLASDDPAVVAAQAINTKTPALGQALAAASVPVVLTAAQITTLTPPAAITGFATAANQTTEIVGLASIDGHVDGIEALLSSIDGKAPALGQALSAGSVPVVLTAGQLTTLTPPVAITGFATETTLAALNTKVTAVNTGAVVLAAGTAAFGKLAANDGVDVGDVTINNAAGAAAVNIQDGGNSITVDGSVSVSGLVPGVSATSLGKAEDAAAADGDTGVMMLAVRKDTAATTVGADGDYHPLEVDANGRLHVISVIAASQTIGLAAGTNGIGKLTANSGVIIGAVEIAATQTVAVTNAGTFAVQAVCTNAGTFAVQSTIAAGATNIAKAEDASSADADVGVPAMAVRKATPANTSGTDGDYEMLQMSAGRLWVDASGVTLTVGSHAVTNAGTFVVQDSEKLADDAAFTVGTTKVNPVGYLADETSTDSVDEGDVGAARITLDRKQIVATYTHTAGGCALYSFLSTAAVQAAAIKASPGQVYGIHFFNVQAAAVYLRLYNQTGSPGTGDTVVYRAIIPGNTAGSGYVVNIPPGIVFDTGIGIRVTGAIADADATALAANVVTGNVLYK